MIVAIDGPAGSGKSSVARAVARRRGLMLLDTGAMYRAITWRCLMRGVSCEDEGAVSREAAQARVSFGVGDDGSQTVMLDGDDVTRQIRLPEVDRNVSAVSSFKAVREAMVAQQRQLAAAQDVIAEGRDVGTVVFPQADVKVFLTADARERAFRLPLIPLAGAWCPRRRGVRGDRVAGFCKGRFPVSVIPFCRLKRARRGRAGRARARAPLGAAADAVLIDSSRLTFDEVVDRIVRMMDRVG
ncbi:(d)CMP kinase [Olsenella massiliensis]|uniref:(d)CMP kinase n=1 Tax=Olsenella massiliensis TaxID=1622075 RepID=UPI00071E3CF2|nr:(d)CMP kinase [Olsenella massiliensis]